MPLGISLSQLIQVSENLIYTAIPELDEAMSGGLRIRSIYEIFGPPGVGKTKLGLHIIRENQQKRILWIETHKVTPVNLVEPWCRLDIIRITKFTKLLYFFQTLREAYDLVILDGMSQLLVDYLHSIMKYKVWGVDSSLHAFKNRTMIVLMSCLTKYTNTQNSCLIMLNDSMNTAYQDYQDLNLVSYSNSRGSFLLKSEPKRNIQMLKSALVANASIGGKDSRWEVFIRNRIGLFWGWDNEDGKDRKTKHKIPRRNRIAVILPLSSDIESMTGYNKPIFIHLNQNSNMWLTVDQYRGVAHDKCIGPDSSSRIATNVPSSLADINAPKGSSQIMDSETCELFHMWKPDNTVTSHNTCSKNTIEHSKKVCLYENKVKLNGELVVYDSEG